MSITSRSSRLRGVLAAGLLSTAVLTGCGGDDAGDEPRADSGAKAAEASEKEEPEPETDLASGLLTAADFGPEAVVASVSPEELEQGADQATSLAEGAEVTPAECNAALEKTQPDFSDFEDVAAVSATEGTTVVVEMLIRGGPIEGSVDQLVDAAVRCPEVQVSSPQFGQATATAVFENLPAPALGDAAAVVRYTTTVALPDGTQQSLPMLLGAVEEGDRLVFLTSLVVDPTGSAAVPLDDAAFTALLELAYETQADALD
jgi:hypothetical protein